MEHRDGLCTMFLFMMPFVVAGIVLGVLEYRKTENEVKKAALLCVYAALGTALWAGVITATVNVNRVTLYFIRCRFCGNGGILRI